MTNSEYRELIEFLGRQFAAIEQRFAAVDHRFAAIDRRFDTLQEHIDGRFREVFGHFDEIYRRLERLEQEYYAITHTLRRIEDLLGDERQRRDILGRRLEELKDQVLLLQARIEELERRLRE